MARGNHDAIAKLILANPSISNAEMARELGMAPTSVSRARNKIGLGAHHRGTDYLIVKLEPDNRTWITDEADATGATPSTLINAIITDARLEDD